MLTEVGASRNIGGGRSPGLLVVLAVWVVLTAMNLDKAYHIDDTFHLLAARHVAADPGAPMSGLVNWRDDPAPIHYGAHPPLFFFLLAGHVSVFGDAERSVHLFMSLFTLLALLSFREALELFRVRRGAALFLMFAFCPPFIAGQNVMLDVPLLSILLSAFVLFVRTLRSGGMLGHWFVASLLTMAVLMKYSALPILLLHPLLLIAVRRYKALWSLMVPVAILGLWSFWNVREFGFVHILARRPGELEPAPLAFLAAIGAHTMVAFALMPWRNKPVAARSAIAYASALVLVGALVLAQALPEPAAAKVLNVAFMINGSAFLLASGYAAMHGSQLTRASFLEPPVLALLHALVLAAFILVFAPYMASRHVMLLLPFLLLAASGAIDSARRDVVSACVLGTVILGSVIGLSDRTYAGYYREMAHIAGGNGDVRVWTKGHWGWQWYAEKAGMLTYSTSGSEFRQGDIMVQPRDIDGQRISLPIDMELVLRKKLWQEADMRTFVSVSDFASLYNASVSKPPWTFSRAPMDTIYIQEIVTGPDVAVRNVIRNMRNDPEWFTMIEAKAKEWELPVDSVLMIDALYVLRQEGVLP